VHVLCCTTLLEEGSVSKAQLRHGVDALLEAMQSHGFPLLLGFKTPPGLTGLGVCLDIYCQGGFKTLFRFLIRPTAYGVVRGVVWADRRKVAWSVC
jgi:hypothetical protein